MHHAQGHCNGGESTYQTRVRVFFSEQIPVTLSAHPNNTVDLPFVLVQWIHSELSPCDRRNTQVWSWPATETCVLFSAKVNSVFSTACSVILFPGHIEKNHIFSQVMTLSNISALHKRSDEMWSLRCFWSCIKIGGTIFAEIFLIPKFSFTICRTCFPVHIHIQFFYCYSHT